MRITNGTLKVCLVLTRVACLGLGLSLDSILTCRIKRRKRTISQLFGLKANQSPKFGRLFLLDLYALLFATLFLRV